MVHKKNEKGTVYVDYSNLNDSYPKDNFPLPRINQIVDATTGNERLSFLDAYSRYNQIPMSEEDNTKAAFIIVDKAFYYKVMSFGLKYVGATYQRMMAKIFEPIIGKTVKAYIDDILVKCKKKENHIQHLKEVFVLIRKHRLKLNREKCTFDIKSGKFLGHLVTRMGIELCPTQVATLVNKPTLKSKKEIQAIIGKLADLNRFILR